MSLLKILLRNLPTFSELLDSDKVLVTRKTPKLDGLVKASEFNKGGSWNTLSDKPSTFPPSSHNHSFESLTGKPTTLAGYGIEEVLPLYRTAAEGPPISLPTVITITGITSPTSSDPLELYYIGDTFGNPSWRTIDETWILALGPVLGGGLAYLLVNIVESVTLYLASKDSPGQPLNTITGWTVSTGAGQPVIEAPGHAPATKVGQEIFVGDFPGPFRVFQTCALSPYPVWRELTALPVLIRSAAQGPPRTPVHQEETITLTAAAGATANNTTTVNLFSCSSSGISATFPVTYVSATDTTAALCAEKFRTALAAVTAISAEFEITRNGAEVKARRRVATDNDTSLAIIGQPSPGITFNSSVNTTAGAAGTEASELRQSCIVGDDGLNKLFYEAGQLNPTIWDLIGPSGVIEDPNNPGEFLRMTIDGDGALSYSPYLLS